ncbi:MAG: YqjK family protein [Betaproteobacteria bacterium]
MTARLSKLRSRRHALAAQSDVLRADLADTFGEIGQALRPARLGQAVLGALGRHPVLVVGAAAALLIVRPRRLRKLIALGSGAAAMAVRAAPVLSAVLRTLRARRGGTATR